MKRSILTIVMMAAIFAAMIARAENSLPQTMEANGRTWVMAAPVIYGDMLVQENYLQGESLESWSELLSAQGFKSAIKIMSVDQFLQHIRQDLVDMCSGIYFKIIEPTAIGQVYEWETTGCEGTELDLQHEIAHVYSQGEDIGMVRYTTKKIPLNVSERQGWIDYLKTLPK